jgi:hypothetical protein
VIWERDIEEAMTAGQLVEALGSIPAEAKVRLEGCDCDGMLWRVFWKPGDEFVSLARTDADWRRSEDPAHFEED